VEIIAGEGNGERHLFNPTTISKLQQAVRLSDQASYDVYAKAINEQSENLMTIRGLFEFDNLNPIHIDEVEPWTEIVKRFKTWCNVLWVYLKRGS
jgi:glutamate synthase (ferredoxin)